MKQIVYSIGELPVSVKSAARTISQMSDSEVCNRVTGLVVSCLAWNVRRENAILNNLYEFNCDFFEDSLSYLKHYVSRY
jgi:hypothetical protein